MNVINCAFPHTRLRRVRLNQSIRELVQESHILTTDLVYPVFVTEGENQSLPIHSMPGQSRVSIDKLLLIANECVKLGILAIGLFPSFETPKSLGFIHESYNPEGLIPKAIKILKHNFPDLLVFTDVALDTYSHDGHDGISNDKGYVLNDKSTEILIKQALAHAYAGADFVCPSDMMDGRIGEIRKALEKEELHNTGIMAYTAKYASSFYGPFRDAVTAPQGLLGRFGKATYQMNPANSDEALHEAALDIMEGADILMVKPGLPYLDVLYRVKSQFKKPTAAYHVSGEYALLKAASEMGYIDYNKVLIESMLCFKRAGADIIWTYAALDVARLINS